MHQEPAIENVGHAFEATEEKAGEGGKFLFGDGEEPVDVFERTGRGHEEDHPLREGEGEEFVGVAGILVRDDGYDEAERV